MGHFLLSRRTWEGEGSRADGAMDGWRYVETKLGDTTPQPRQAPDWAQVCCTAPPVGPPAAPTGVTASAAIGAADVSWQAPTGPNPVTGYVVETAPGATRTHVDAGPRTACPTRGCATSSGANARPAATG
ncbi:hypothetical protein LO772_33925 [Yinghuangia sp. ASG 101]|uniref:hypothetical protein n=1 Tax=Yinghuangia sp. ASG 101 TaxID=2896848 RepID=UPI001E3314BB|nr:hypothetical protein [Yinghuangia sp. ASG 101]UGQ11712.1 hypothetical protein LO772_33925 [Yinghuangia sp. ASG 101]